jgi:predicted RNA binding protein with dsRBD fold (UPF0201 family)
MPVAKSSEEDERLDVNEVGSAPAQVEAISVEAITRLYATEDSGAVGKAILNLFPTMDLEVANGRMTGRAEGSAALARFRRRIHEMRIRDTARSQLGKGMDGEGFRFSLNKQSAFANVPNFATEGAPLGDIDISVTSRDPEVVARWLCELDED